MRKILALGVIAMVIPAVGFAFGKNKVQYREFNWTILRSEHFDIYYYPEEESLAERAARLADAAYDTLSRSFGHELKARVPIIIYRSPNEFQETNVTLELLGEGTGGFTETFKNRVVLPFAGSYDEFRHVLVHELTHVFSFDMVYGGLLESIFTRQYLFALPLWFIEGITEYESQRWDVEAEMVMRDAALNGYYFPLYQDLQGYLAYKQGQSVIKYIVEKYGSEKLTDIIQATARARNLDKALMMTIGVDSEGLTEAWVEHIKKQYWPEIAKRTGPDELGSRLTDHRKDDSFTNIMPSISPDGQKIVFLSDRSGYDDLYLMSAVDGKIIKRLVKGQRSQDFESFHTLRSAISWAPDGKRIAFVTKRGDRDVINIIDAQSGKRIKRISPRFDSAYYPAYSPDGSRLAFVGSDDGRPGIFVVDLDDEEAEALHVGALEYSGVTWSPDGSQLAFSCIAPGSVDSLDLFRQMGPLNRPDRDIYLVGTADGILTRVTLCRSDDMSPTWSADGREMIFVSDRNGGYNLYAYDFADSTTAQLTDVLGGIFNPTWSREGDRLAYTCFHGGGWDVYQIKDPVGTFEALETEREAFWQPSVPWFAEEVAEPTGGAKVGSAEIAGAGEIAGAAPSTGTSASADVSVETAASELAATDTTASMPAAAETPGLVEARDALPVPEVAGAEPESLGSEGEQTTVLWPPPEGQKPDPRMEEKADRDTAGAVTEAGYQKERYKLRFTPDWVAGSFQYSTAFGLGGMTRFSASDILGNHQIFVGFDLYSDLEESDGLVVYSYLPKRIDYSAGVFHYKNYYYSDRTTMGSQIGEGREDKLFSERNYGGIFAVTLPIDIFRRFDFDFTAMRTEYEIYEEGSEDLAYPIIDTVYTKDVFVPRLSYVKDTTIWGATGPAAGCRYSLSIERSLVDVFGSDLSYTTGVLDYRKYFRATANTHFATRLVAATSRGSQPTSFYLGGPYTLRGYDYFEFAGNNIWLGNAELRFPFVESLVLRGPLPISLGGIRGVFFFDVGGAWNRYFEDVFTGKAVNLNGDLDKIVGDYGFGMRMWLAYFLLRLDYAWATDFSGDLGRQVYFSLGTDF